MSEPTIDLETGTSGTPRGSAPEAADATGSEARELSSELINWALESIDEMIIGIDEEGIFRFVSTSVRHIGGYEPSELVGRNMLDLLHPDEHENVVGRLDRWAGRSGVGAGPTVRVHHGRGGWLDIALETITGPEVAPFATLVVCRPTGRGGIPSDDIPPGQEDRLTRVASAFAHLPTNRIDDGVRTALAEMGSLEGVDRVCIVTIDVDEDEGREVLHNTHEWTAPGIGSFQDRHKYMPMIDSPTLRAMHRLEVLHIPEVATLGDEWRAEKQLWRSRGTVSMVAVPMVDEGMLTGFIGFEAVRHPHPWDVHHIATLRSGAGIIAQALARQAAEAQLAYQARNDSLTGLGNRWDFLDHLERAVASLERDTDDGVAVLLFDLDRFKVVNDSLGHTAGDQLLRFVAHRLDRVRRPIDTIARLGGDEIVVLCRDVSGPDEAVVLAKNMQQALVQPMELGGHEAFVTTSVGVAFTDTADDTAEDLLRDSDAAMYIAKARGRNRVEVFDEELRELVRERLHNETELQRAVLNRELTVHYQPEVALSDGRVVGAEALVRWQHPSRGLIPAFEFIAMAEETGAILEIGPWVLEQACSKLGDWLRRFPDRQFVMRVNLSARQLIQPDLVTSVEDAIEFAGIPPDSLCLEITETTLMADAEISLEVLERLHALGVELAVDDFGTGYSSLSYLKRLPVDVVKVDQSFVDGLGTDPDDTSIVAAIVSLASSLSLQVTAEGVETQLQHEELVRLGVERAQGFLLGRPMPADELEVLLGA